MTSIKDSIRVPLLPSWNARSREDNVDGYDVKIFPIPKKERELLCGSLGEHIVAKTDVIFGEGHTDYLEEEDVEKLKVFLEPYKKDLPTFYEAVLLADNKLKCLDITLIEDLFGENK
ncbi:MAG: hypothetical protein Q4P08_06280 [Eubacteriales bacterium]|nr:hypothetical protein [Eubacteriales bacterium]